MMVTAATEIVFVGCCLSVQNAVHYNDNSRVSGSLIASNSYPGASLSYYNVLCQLPSSVVYRTPIYVHNTPLLPTPRQTGSYPLRYTKRNID